MGKADKPDTAGELTEDHEEGVDQAAPEGRRVEKSGDWDGKADGAL